MDILEAKAFFKEYNGLEIHMCHDDTRKYQEYRSLHITEISKNRWRREIIEEIFAQLKKVENQERYQRAVQRMKRAFQNSRQKRTDI